MPLLNYTKALPSVLSCLCPGVPSWKIFPPLSKISHFNFQASYHHQNSSLVFSAHDTHQVLLVLPPLTYGIYLFISIANLTSPFDIVVYVCFYWCLPCAGHCKCFPCIISFKSLNSPESYMLLFIIPIFQTRKPRCRKVK